MTKSLASLGLGTVGTTWPDCPSWAQIAYHRGAEPYETVRRKRRQRSADWIYLKPLEKHSTASGRIMANSQLKWRKPVPVQRPRWNDGFQVVFAKANPYCDATQRDYFERQKPASLFERRVGGRAGGGSSGIAADRYQREFFRSLSTLPA
jgi:hypothetical protein